MDALDRLYEELAKEQEEEAKNQEVAAARLQENGDGRKQEPPSWWQKGDEAFTEADYESAKVYYAMALDKYQKLEDVASAEQVKHEAEKPV